MESLLGVGGRIGAVLKRDNATLAVAESSAGGLISAALLAVPGASAYFLGGAVVYTRQSRQILLGITDAEMAEIRPSSEAYALLLARSVRARFGAVWSIAETGAAGPAGSRYGHGPGHACLAICGPVEAATTLETASPDRVANMCAFAAAALALLERALDK
jgi:nicotinamide-nucleotide amidase